jgi:tRNA 2-thiouridine synthesizing protein D
MHYSLLITAAPDEPAAKTALLTARAIVERGHTLYRLFFYADGVHLALEGSGETASAWQAFIKDQELDATVCSGASARRGLFSGDGRTPATGFELAGLGQWIDALAASDRVLEFGD